MTDALLEDVIEITWMFEALIQSGDIMSWDDLIEKFNGSDGIKQEIKQMAVEFEKKYSFEIWEDTDIHYIEEIEKFARERLIDKFGIEEKRK